MSPPSARCSTGCSITATCSSVDLEAGGPRPRRPRRGTRAFFDARALPSRSRDLSLSARMAAEWGGLRRPTIPDLNRRSGRVPALPYPPSRLGQYKPSSGWFAKNACRNRHRRVINTLVLVQFRWPVLKWPRMAGFQVAAEEARARIVHSAIGLRRMLLVIDDAWRIEDALAFRIGGPHCGPMVTPRSQAIAEAFAGAGAILIPELTE